MIGKQRQHPFKNPAKHNPHGWTSRHALEGVLNGYKSALNAICNGVGTIDDWERVIGMAAHSQAIHDMRLVQSTAVLSAAKPTIAEINAHAENGCWTPPNLRVDQIDALQNLYCLFKTQIEQITRYEFSLSLTKAVNRAKSAGEPVRIQQ